MRVSIDGSLIRFILHKCNTEFLLISLCWICIEFLIGLKDTQKASALDNGWIGCSLELQSWVTEMMADESKDEDPGAKQQCIQ